MAQPLNKFDVFALDILEGRHNLRADTLKVMLTNVQPVRNGVTKADITEIAAGNGYAAGGLQLSLVSLTQAAGVAKLLLADGVFTASGGALPTARWPVLWNATASRLIGWWDYGTPFAVTAGETFTVDFDDAAGALTLS